MKKLLFILGIVCLGLFTLTSCDMGSANNDYNMHLYLDDVKFESHIYCTAYNACTNCEKWSNNIDISSAYSVSCTNVGYSDSTHIHYCITYVK